MDEGTQCSDEPGKRTGVQEEAVAEVLGRNCPVTVHPSASLSAGKRSTFSKNLELLIAEGRLTLAYPRAKGPGPLHWPPHPTAEAPPTLEATARGDPPRTTPGAHPRPAPRVRRRRPPFTTCRKVAATAGVGLSRATMGVRQRRTAAGTGTERWRGPGRWELAPGRDESSGLALRRSRGGRVRAGRGGIRARCGAAQARLM